MATFGSLAPHLYQSSQAPAISQEGEVGRFGTKKDLDSSLFEEGRGREFAAAAGCAQGQKSLPDIPNYYQDLTPPPPERWEQARPGQLIFNPEEEPLFYTYEEERSPVEARVAAASRGLIASSEQDPISSAPPSTCSELEAGGTENFSAPDHINFDCSPNFEGLMENSAPAAAPISWNSTKKDKDTSEESESGFTGHSVDSHQGEDFDFADLFE